MGAVGSILIAAGGALTVLALATALAGRYFGLHEPGPPE
jgi:hypothetical protein